VSKDTGSPYLWQQATGSTGQFTACPAQSVVCYPGYMSVLVDAIMLLSIVHLSSNNNKCLCRHSNVLWYLYYDHLAHLMQMSVL